MTTPDAPRCYDCRWSREDGPQLFCTYNPPQCTIIMVPTQSLAGPPGIRPVPLASFPPVMAEQACSKFATLVNVPLEH